MRHIFKHNSTAGFSLIETIVYISLFIVISTVLVTTLFGMLHAYTELRVNDDLLDAEHVSMERLTREIRNAITIDPASSFGSDPGTLTLDAKDGAGSPKTIKFDVSPSGTLEVLDSTDSTERALTGSKVRVTSLVFRNIADTTGSAVRVEATFESLRSSVGQSVTVSDTAVIRGSYATPTP